MVAARTKALSKKRPAGRWAPAMGESKQTTTLHDRLTSPYLKKKKSFQDDQMRERAQHYMNLGWS